MKTNEKTNLIYFGDLENSKYGTYRSIIALFLIVLVLLFVQSKSFFFKDIFKERLIGLVLLIIAVVSAICVIVPHNDYDVLKYGASIGAFLAIIAIVSYSKTLNWNSLLFLVSSILVISVISWIVFKLSTVFNWYPVSPCE